MDRVTVEAVKSVIEDRAQKSVQTAVEGGI